MSMVLEEENKCLLEMLQDAEVTTEHLQRTLNEERVSHTRREKELLQRCSSMEKECREWQLRAERAQVEAQREKELREESDRFVEELQAEFTKKKAFGADRLQKYEATIAGLEDELRAATRRLIENAHEPAAGSSSRSTEPSHFESTAVMDGCSPPSSAGSSPCVRGGNESSSPAAAAAAGGGDNTTCSASTVALMQLLEDRDEEIRELRQRLIQLEVAQVDLSSLASLSPPPKPQATRHTDPINESQSAADACNTTWHVCPHCAWGATSSSRNQEQEEGPNSAEQLRKESPQPLPPARSVQHLLHSHTSSGCSTSTFSGNRCDPPTAVPSMATAAQSNSRSQDSDYSATVSTRTGSLIGNAVFAAAPPRKARPEESSTEYKPVLKKNTHILDQFENTHITIAPCLSEPTKATTARREAIQHEDNDFVRRNKIEAAANALDEARRYREELEASIRLPPSKGRVC